MVDFKMSNNINDLMTSQSKMGYYSNVKSFEEQSSLGKDSFLKILVAQLQNQDPTKPLEDREYIAQMSQFSSLEQMSNLNKTMSKFVEFSMGNSLTQQSHLIDKIVKWEQKTELATLSGEGTVIGISSKNGEILATLDNGKQIPIKDIISVGQDEVSEETTEETTEGQETVTA